MLPLGEGAEVPVLILEERPVLVGGVEEASATQGEPQSTRTSKFSWRTNKTLNQTEQPSQNFPSHSTRHEEHTRSAKISVSMFWRKIKTCRTGSRSNRFNRCWKYLFFIYLQNRPATTCGIDWVPQSNKKLACTRSLNCIYNYKLS